MTNINNIVQQYKDTILDSDVFIDINLIEQLIPIVQKEHITFFCVIDENNKIIEILTNKENDDELHQYFNNNLNNCRVFVVSDNDIYFTKLLNEKLKQNKIISLIKCDVNYMNNIDVCFYNKNKINVVNVPELRYINKYGLKDKLNKCIAENQTIMENVDKENITNKAILVMAEIDKNDNALNDLQELKCLAETDHINVVDRISQKRDKPDIKYVIGEGKIEEIKESIKLNNADLVIFDNELTGSKINNLEQVLGVKVIDRSMLILDIFANRAQSREGKLQVELAQLKNSLPRLNGLMGTNGRFGGGVGMRGPGESKIEINRRAINEKIARKEKELKEVKRTRNINRQNRKNSNKKIVSIVGYTNSGKSSLMNVFTHADVYEKNELFATLDTTSRNFWLNDKTEIILTDTVGFINKLPHEFINAFSSTLEETKYADLLLHIVDLSNKDYQKHIEVVNKVLNKLGVNIPTILVFNKIDLIKNFDKNDYKQTKNCVFISVKQNINLTKLKQKIIEFL